MSRQEDGSVVHSYAELLDLHEMTGTPVPRWLLEKLGRREKVPDRDKLMDAARACGVPERYVGAVPDPTRNAAMSAGTGYYVHGTTGDGKTTRAAELLLGWIMDGMGSAKWVSSVTLLSEIADTYGGRGSEMEVIARYATCGLLVVDDLGKERATEWTLSKLFQLFDERYSHCLPTIVTTQYGAAELGRMMAKGSGDVATAQAIVSRIRETYRAIDCGPEDRRLG